MKMGDLGVPLFQETSKWPQLTVADQGISSAKMVIYLGPTWRSKQHGGLQQINRARRGLNAKAGHLPIIKSSSSAPFLGSQVDLVLRLLFFEGGIERENNSYPLPPEFTLNTQ